MLAALDILEYILSHMVVIQFTAVNEDGDTALHYTLKHWKEGEKEKFAHTFVSIQSPLGKNRREVKEYPPQQKNGF